MTTNIRNYEVPDLNQDPWFDVERQFYTDVINKLPANDTSHVTTEHDHASLNVAGTYTVGFTIGADGSAYMPLQDDGILTVSSHKIISGSIPIGVTGIQGVTGIAGSDITGLTVNEVLIGDSTIVSDPALKFFRPPINDGTGVLSLLASKGSNILAYCNDDGRGIEIRSSDGTAQIEFYAGSSDITCYFPFKAQGAYASAATGFQWHVNQQGVGHFSSEAMRLTPTGNLLINDQFDSTEKLSVVGRSKFNGHLSSHSGGFGMLSDYTTVPSSHTSIDTYALGSGSSFLQVSTLTDDASGVVMAVQVGDHLIIRNESASAYSWWLVSGDPAAPTAKYECPKSDETCYHFICYDLDEGLQQSWWSRI